MSQHNPAPRPGESPPTLAPDEACPPIPPTRACDPTPLPVTIDQPAHPAVPDDFQHTLPAAPGHVIVNPPLSGRNYQTVRELGRGGMGVVYLARQVGLNRLVALKMILSGEYARPEEVTRFRNEAEAVAKLHHPNIIHIYEIGEDGGRPYFAMELADAGSLAERLNGKPLPGVEAARLVEILARAMHHAHLNGIVHRDLKPINVLLSTSGSDSFSEIRLNAEPGGAGLPLSALLPKITDFGLAKRMDSKGRTLSGHVVGTVNYMAPEQAEGRSRDVGPCSDIYGLGAILYECLTGRPPFSGDSLVATLEQVRTEEPKPVRVLNPSCPRDLETICLKCLDKVPNRRYATALELADDLRAFLEDRPIKARPVSAWERVWRGVQRRRREVLWASFAGLALLVLGGVLWRKAVVERREHEQARQEYVRAVTAIQAARHQLVSGNTATLLAELPRHFQQVQQKIDDAALRQEAAAACDGLGETLWKQGRRDEAIDAGKVAHNLYAGLLETAPERSHRDALARLRLREGQIRADGRNYALAESEYRAALAELKRLVEEEPGNRDYQRHLAEVHHQLGELHNTLKKRSRAVEFYQESLAIRRKLAEAEPAQRAYRRDLARSHGYLGDAWLELNDRTKAWDAYAEAEKIRQQLVDEDASDIDARFQLARSHANEGYYGLWIGDAPRALAAYQKARVLQEKLLAEQPGRAEFASDLGWSLLNLAELKLDRDGATPEVLALLEQARNLFEGLSGANDSRSVARTHIDLALYYREKDTAQTHKSLDKARQLLQRLNEEDRQQRRTEDPEDMYHLALVAALEGSLLRPDDAQERRRHANRAMSHLDYAIRQGYTRAARLGKDVAGMKLLWEVDRDRMEDLVKECRKTDRSP